MEVTYPKRGSCTCVCVKHEETDYIQSILDYNNIDNVVHNDYHRSKRGDVPTNTLEKTRLYKWCVATFTDEISCREYITKWTRDSRIRQR